MIIGHASGPNRLSHLVRRITHAEIRPAQGEILFFHNNATIGLYRLTPARWACLRRFPGYYEHLNALGDSMLNHPRIK